MARRKGGAAKPLAKLEPTARDLAIYHEVSKGHRPYSDIGQEFDITPQRVCQIAEEIDKYLVPHFMDKIRQTKVRHTGHLHHMFQQAMAAWEKSKLDPHEETNHVNEDGDSSHTLKRKTTAGDPTFLNQARAILADIRKIWGADAPAPKDDSGTRAAGVPYEEAVKEYAESQIEKYRRMMMEPSTN